MSRNQKFPPNLFLSVLYKLQEECGELDLGHV